MRLITCLATGLALAGLPEQLLAQRPASDSGARPAPSVVTVVPGARYRAGGLHRFLLGSHYRDLWTTPVQAETLDLDHFAGGLTPIKRGGGKQTKSLRFRGADGREYAFRSLDKDPSALLPPELRGTVVSSILQDQISAGHPGAPFVVAPLLEATGVLHTEPRLVVLPDGDPRLGEFEPEFGGMLGVLEERPNGGDEGDASFAGAREIISTDKLLKKLEKGPDDLVDARAYAAARLMDVFLGDWDRHRDQWRWARLSDDRPRRWIPIPRDRDQAFARYDGLLLTIARGTAPQLVKFGPKSPGMLGLTWNGRDIDRQFLVGLERPVWDSVASELRSRLTDEVIEGAVARLPAGFVARDSARLARALKARRDRLGEAARSFYRHLAGEVDVQATDIAEMVTAERVGGQYLDLTIARVDADGAEPFFHRRFDDRETHEVRLFLHGGDDRVVVRGSGGGVRLRVLTGGGSDVVADSSAGGPLAFYARDQNDSALAGRHVPIDRKPYHPAHPAQRDWGNRWLSQVWLSSGPDVGLFVGSGVLYTRYGFRQDPFAHRYRFRAGWATGASTGAAELSAIWHRPNSAVSPVLLARASGIEVIRFHGFGNETTAEGPSEFFRVDQVDFLLAPAVRFPVAPRLEVTVGPRLQYSKTDFDPNRFITLTRPYGSGDFGRVSLAGDLEFDSRDRENAATRGALLSAGGSYFPEVFDVERNFGEVHGVAATYFSAHSWPLDPTLALRVGGKKVWGTFPYQESAFIGGNSTVRLGRQNRYAGDASLYAGAELRLFLSRIFLIIPGDFGIFGLGDIGRVYFNGESSDKWHGAAGGGIWLAFLGRANTVSAAVTRSEERTGVYLRAGFGF